MPKILSEKQIIKILCDALQNVGSARVLSNGSRAELLALQLDTIFATKGNLTKLVDEIKEGFANQGAQVLLGKAEVKSAATFGDLLLIVRTQQVV